MASTNSNTNRRMGPPRWGVAHWLVAALLLAAASRASADNDQWTDLSSDNTWTNANNWEDLLAPSATNNIFFIDAGASGLATTGPLGTPDNIVTTNVTIQSLNYQTTNYNHTTLINPGATLSIVGPGTYALFSGTLSDTAANLNEYATINGPGGTLAVTNLNGSVSARQGEVTSSHSTTLDMRGLDTFMATVTNILAGGENIGKDTGTLYLAKTNFITCTALSTTPGLIVGNNNTSGSKTANAYLGLSNVIYCDGGLAVPKARMTGNLNFFSNNSAAYFRNQAGTGPQNEWAIGWNNTSGTGTSCNGTVSFALGTVDAMIGTLLVGAGETSGSSTGGSTGTLNFYGGTINANTVIIGETFGTVPSGVTGTINVLAANAPAQLIIDSNLIMGQTASSYIPSSTLNIGSGAVVTVLGNIVTGFGSGGAGTTGNTTIKVLGSTLQMSGTMGAASSSTGPLTTLLLSNSTLTINLGSSPNPVNALCTMATFDAFSNCTLSISGGAISKGQFSVIKYTSQILDDGFNAFTTVTLPSQAQGYLSNNVANNSIDLVVTNVFAPIWNGTHNGNWDINTTANWKTSTGAPLTYEQISIPGNLVTFDDTATGTTTVNLMATNLAPSSISVNNSVLNYTFTGSGQLTGPGGLAKNGTAALLIATTGTNSFVGPVSIGGGLLQLGVSNGLPTTANLTLADTAGATFDLNNWSQTIASLSGGGSDGGGNVTLGTGTLTISGSGGNYYGIISGNGGLVMAGGSQVLNQPNLYTGNTLISAGTLIVANSSGNGTGTGGIDIEGGTLQFGANASGYDGSVAAGVITNNGQIVFDCSDNVTFTNFIMGTGSLTKEGLDTVSIQTANTYSGTTTIANGPLAIYNANALGGGLITVENLATSALDLAGNITVTNPLLIYSKGGALGGPPAVENLSGSNALTGVIQLTSSGTDVAFQSDNGSVLTVGENFTYESAGSHQNVWLRGSGVGIWEGSITDTVTNDQPVALIVQDGGTWTLTGSSINTFSGGVTVSQSTLIVDGSLLGAGTVTVGGALGGTLAGSGLIAGPVSVGDNVYFLPGDPNAPLSVSNALTISNSLTLSGGTITVFNLSKTNGILGYNRVNGLTSVSYNGNLIINLTGNLNGREVFHLFNAASYSGSFSYIQLPTLPAALSWDTSQLAVDGTLRLTSGVSIESASLGSGGVFQLIGNGTASQPYRILATTNLSLPITNWVEVGSGTLSGTPFNFTDTNAPGLQQRYYMLVSP